MKVTMGKLAGRINGRELRASVQAGKLGFRASTTEQGQVLEIYGDIGPSFWGDGITAAELSAALGSGTGPVTVRLNSPGGDCFEGVAIYNLLKTCGRVVNVVVDGLAASAASIIAMAGESICMGTGTMLMIHPAFMMVYGDSVDMRDAAAILEKVSSNMADIYAARTGLDREKVLELMYEETWMNGLEAVDMGFATEIVPDSSKAGEVAAAYNLEVFGKTPEALKVFAKAPAPSTPMADLALQELKLYGGK